MRRSQKIGKEREMYSIKYSIRRAHPGDASRIVQIHLEATLATYVNPMVGLTADRIKSLDWFSDNWADKTSRQIAFPKPGECTWVAETDDVVVAFAQASIMYKRNFLEALYVIPGYFGKGAAPKLMQTVLSHYAGKPVYLQVVKYNVRAQRFYQKNGFVETIDAGLPSIMQWPGDINLPIDNMKRQGV
jgi:GNAT superfamily N-acetyltransferase